MFCPSCNAEYQQGYLRCAECDVPLVSEPAAAEPSPAEREPLAVLWRGQDPVAFSAILSALADAEIPYRESQSGDYTACLSQPFALSFYGLPHWRILVHPADLEHAKNIAEDALRPAPIGPVAVEQEIERPEAVPNSLDQALRAESAADAEPPVCIWASRDASLGGSLRAELLEHGVPCWTISGASGEIRLFVSQSDQSRARLLIGTAMRSEGAA